MSRVSLRFAFVAGALATGALAFAAEPAADASASGKPQATKRSHAIIRLLNSRVAGSPFAYEEAAKIVREDADKVNARGEPVHPLQRFVIALFSNDRDAPAAARLSPSKRAAYLDSARAKITQLAERKNNALAWYLLSIEHNDMDLLRRAADGGNVQALNALGTIDLMNALNDSSMSTNEVLVTMSRSFARFKQASDRGDANGLYNLGMCYLNGYGCERNENLAFECFRTTAEGGHPEAINNLGGFYRDGIVVRRNVAKATECFARSAKLGNSYGELNYALALQRGEGVEKNEKKAFELLSRAAESGNVEAMNAYGMCYYSGSGVKKDASTAFAWFMRAASFGFPQAMENLAACYEHGEGVEKDMRSSTLWKVRARANSGDRNAAAWLMQNGHSLR